MSTKTFGRCGESLAREYLLSMGYEILEANFRSRMGEIDLIAKYGQTICFVEVKARQSSTQGHPLEAITPWKVRKLTQMALFYLKHKCQSVDIPSRFDVITIIQAQGQSPRIEHLKNAFDAAY